MINFVGLMTSTLFQHVDKRKFKKWQLIFQKSQQNNKLLFLKYKPVFQPINVFYKLTFFKEHYGGIIAA